MKSVLVILIAALFFIIACNQPANHTNVSKQHVPQKKHKPSEAKYPLTDSSRLMLHLDSLSKPPFPYLSEGRNYEPLNTISLAAFKNKQLFNLPLKLIPTQIGADGLDHASELDENGVLPDSVKETFNLVNTVIYKAEGVLVATTPKFVVLDFDGTLVTMTYNVDVIDAIISWEGHGNNHWKVWRETVIKKDLSLVINQYYTHDVPGYDDSVTSNWFIDATGHFRKKIAKVKKHQ